MLTLDRPGSRHLSLTRSWPAAALGLAAAATGLALATAPALQRPLLGGLAVVLVALAAAQSRACGILVGGLVAMTFITRFRIGVGGLNFLPEHAVLLACVVALALVPRARSLRSVATLRPVVFLGLFVGWAGVVSLLVAPDPRASLAIVGWLGLDWLLLVVVVSAFPRAIDLERVGHSWALVAAVAAVGLYLISTVGGVDFGTQREVITGARSAYGLSYESNVLAGLMATWVFIALTSQDPTTGRVRALLIAFGTAAMLLAYTRAAVLGLVAGVAVWAAFGGWLARRRLVRVAAVAAALALAAVAVVPTVTTPLYDKLSSASPFSSSTGAVRVTSWSLALGDIGGGRWLAGLGVNSYGQRHLDFTKPGTDTPGYLGNLPLQIVYETGVVGVLLVAAALASLRPMLGPRRGRALGLLVLYTCTAIATSPFWFGSSWILIALAVLAELERSDTAGA